jgi:hypothetical protein
MCDLQIREYYSKLFALGSTGSLSFQRVQEDLVLTVLNSQVSIAGEFFS